MKKKIMAVFGTRPEAIKMCPLVKELKTRKNLNTIVCVTGQHRQMLDQVLEAFHVVPDYDLSIMKDKQTLFDVTINILEKMKAVLEEVKPDVVLVHGDTSTTFVTALACFYLQIPVGHVEAGLRTYNIYSPYPEETNRILTDRISNYLFAPSSLAIDNLEREGIEEGVYFTGDVMYDIFLKMKPKFDYSLMKELNLVENKFVIMTMHRDFNVDNKEKLEKILTQVSKVAKEIKVVFPIHPRTKKRINEFGFWNILKDIIVIDPIHY